MSSLFRHFPSLNISNGPSNKRARGLVVQLACTFWTILAPPLVASAQTSDAVSWTIAAQPDAAMKPGARLALQVRAVIPDNWHVYALEQSTNGPIPLRVSLDTNQIVGADGAASATSPSRARDAAFGFDTQFYDHALTVTVPVRVALDAEPGVYDIPVNVRFQSCNGQTCRPPKTIRLTASVNVRRGD